ncbi:MAG TPA: hypothetical protein VFF52_07560, partial [Isosphaeraceae bacterium]|nr:hypothetical protein [Isosphaeraceae bacterium]
MASATHSERGFLLVLILALLPGAAARAEEPAAPATEGAERAPVDGTVFSAPADRARLAGMWGADVRKRRIAANERENAAWAQVRSRSDWERFRDARIEALQQSLGAAQEPPAD